jgi:cytochrome c oxidase subunit IV
MKQPNTDSIKTILVITVGFLIISYITKEEWPLRVSLVIGLLGLISDFVASKIHYLWMKLAWLLSLIVPNIVLSIIFFVLLTPIALLSKIFGDKNPLYLKNTNKSMFKNSNKEFDKNSFEKPW